MFIFAFSYRYSHGIPLSRNINEFGSFKKQLI